MNHTDDNLLIRKNAKDLTPEEKQRFVNAVLALKNRPSPYTIFNPYTNTTETPPNAYDYYVRLHQIAFAELDSTGRMGEPMPPVHGTPPFLPWHREFLRRFEQDLRTVDATVVLPYWDPTDSESTRAVFRDDLMGGSGDRQDNYFVRTGPFRAPAFQLRNQATQQLNQQNVWTLRFNSPSQLLNPNGQARFLQRTFGATFDPSSVFFGTANLPTADQVEEALRQLTYNTFRSTVEATPHGRPHVWVGGNMGLATSPNDPVFFLHHANIDRLWDEWIERHQNEPNFRPYVPPDGAGAEPGTDINDPLFNFGNVSSEQLLATEPLGYLYDTSDRQPTPTPTPDPQNPVTEPSIPQISVNDLSVSEGSRNFSFTISLSEPSKQTVTVDYALTFGNTDGNKGFETVLSGNQEVPPVNSKATGFGSFKLNPTGEALTYATKISGLDFGPLLGKAPQTADTADDVIGVHFHAGSLGVNGPIALDITKNQDADDAKATINPDGSTTITGVWETTDQANQSISNFTASLRSATAGEDTKLYLNVHTKGSPSGIIRGQITGGRPDVGTVAPKGQITFNPGQTKQLISLNIIDDRIPEFDELAPIFLSNPKGATIADAQGIATILDNDGGGGKGVPETIQTGTNGNDTLAGDSGNNTLSGGDGDDVFYAGEGDDLAFGGNGKDLFYGDGGKDTFYGNGGDDTLYGGKGNNTLYGGQGNDDIYGDGDQDVLFGDKGSDRMYGKGKDQLYGNGDNDSIYGGEGDSTIYGGQGDDFVEGDTGNDVVSGDKGKDRIIGVNPKAATPGRGEVDTLIGGSDADIFVLGSKISAYYNDGKSKDKGLSDYALITDFNTKEDVILLQGSAKSYQLAAASKGLPSGTAIYQRTVGEDELIAIVQGATDLSLSSGYFNYL